MYFCRRFYFGESMKRIFLTILFYALCVLLSAQQIALLKYNGGGHSMAAGANINSFEESDALLKDADEIVKNYKKSFK